MEQTDLARLYKAVERLPAPYFDDGAGRVIYHGCALELLPLVQGGSFDCILTDPPYGIGYVTAWRSRTHKLVKPVANDKTLDVVEQVWPHAIAALADDRHWYAFATLKPEVMHHARKFSETPNKRSLGTKATGGRWATWRLGLASAARRFFTA